VGPVPDQHPKEPSFIPLADKVDEASEGQSGWINIPKIRGTRSPLTMSAKRGKCDNQEV
jgi:hypothetical protein